jgi:hypothetical protein
MNVNFKVIFMKKQLLFCSLALASSLTAMAGVGDKVKDLSQLSNDKCYIIQAAQTSRGAWQYSETSPDVLQSTKKNGATVSAADPTQQFAFIRSDKGNYYIYSIGGSKFLYYQSESAVGLSENVVSEAYLAGFISSTHTDKDNYPWVATLNGQQMNLTNATSEGGGNGVVFYDGHPDDPGNAISITEAGTFDPTEAMQAIEAYEAIADLLAEANAYLRIPGNSVGGYSADLINALNEACGGDNVANAEDLNTEAFNTAIEDLRNATPIAFSNEKLYQIRNYTASNGYLTSRQETDASRIWASAKSNPESLPEVTDADKWQLYNDGIHTYLYNKGTKSFAYYDQPNNQWLLTKDPAYINVGANTSKGDGAYWIQDPNYTGQLQHMHININQADATGLKGWGTDADASNFYFVEVDGQVDDLLWASLAAIKAQAQSILNCYDAAKANYVGAYSAESIQALQDAVDAAEADATAESINAAIKAIKAVKASAKPVKAGKYYVIQNANTFDDTKLKSIYENPDGQNIAWNTVTQSAAELWQLVPADNGEYLIKSANTGKYIRYENDGVCAKMGTADDRPFTLAPGADNYTFGLRCYGTDRGDYSDMTPHTADGFGAIGGTDVLEGGYVSTYKGSRFAAWNLVEVSSVKLTVGETGYATAYFPFAVTIPAGVAAYTVAAAADGVATLKKLSGTIIPAHTGVVLSGTANTPCTFEIAANAAAVDGNMLEGMTIATAVPAGTKAYILANGSEGVGFYRLSESESDRTIGANKAYLIVDDAAEPSVFSLKLDGGLTGIEGVESAGADAPVYDLQGRRLPQVPEKGIYIQNGKKIMK